MDKNRGDCGEGRYLYSVLTNEEGRVIMDCFNSDVSTVYEEYDGDDCYRWDAQGEADISYALEAVNNHERLIQRVQELEKALRIARGRMSHSYNCVKVNPTEEWHKDGSVTVGACICEIATVDAALAGAQKEATK